MNTKRNRKYWVTTHYPPEKGDMQSADIFLKEQDYDFLQKISPGDYVVIYEAKSGGDYYDKNGGIVKLEQGREGVVIISEVSAFGKRRLGNTPIKYIDGRVMDWSWQIECAAINSSGYIHRKDFLKSIGYKETFNLHGFGEKHSGLKEIFNTQFNDIYTQYKKSMRPLSKPANQHKKNIDAGEGDEHKRLKEAVFREPERLLEEYGLRGHELEFPYETGDRADIILMDAMERPVAVEIEVSVKKGNLVGMLQAIKYKYMFAVINNKRFEEVRSFLVAHEIAKDVQRACKKYGVEYFEVKRDKL